jgi:hypothetical protein
LFGIKQKSETEITIGEKKCVERIGVRRGKQLPSGSAKSYFRWAGGVNEEIVVTEIGASLAQKHDCQE